MVPLLHPPMFLGGTRQILFQCKRQCLKIRKAIAFRHLFQCEDKVLSRDRHLAQVLHDVLGRFSHHVIQCLQIDAS